MACICCGLTSAWNSVPDTTLSYKYTTFSSTPCASDWLVAKPTLLQDEYCWPGARSEWASR